MIFTPFSLCRDAIAWMCTKEGILALKAAANEAGVMFKTTIESPEEEMSVLSFMKTSCEM